LKKRRGAYLSDGKKLSSVEEGNKRASRSWRKKKREKEAADGEEGGSVFMQAECSLKRQTEKVRYTPHPER